MTIRFDSAAQAAKAEALRALHRPGRPLVLYNIWDAAGAREIAEKGAQAVATGSWSVAAAHGYGDGEQIPLDFVLRIVERIAASTELPLTVDFEGGYAVPPEALRDNTRRLIRAGAVGVNFEDRIIVGQGLHPVELQAERLRALRAAGADEGVPLFVNARTDLFLQEPDATRHAALVEDALRRAEAYRAAGADGFFVPGLTDSELIRRICADQPLPVNVMMRGGLSSVAEVAALGVARASFGPAPFRAAQADLAARFAAALVS